MKKYFGLILIMLLMAVVSFGSSPVFALETPEYVRVIHTIARVFDTTENLQTLTQTQLGERTIKILYLHDVVRVESEENEFYKVEVEVENQTQQGYIYKAAVIDNNLKSPTKFLQTNASITENTFAFEKEGDTFTKTNLQIEKDTRIRLVEGYKTNVQYTRISFTKDGQVVTTYVETSLIKTDGVNRSILLAITLLTLSFSGIGILYKFLKRKEKLNKNN